MMPSWLGYVEARRRLDERFGNPFVLSQCYLKRLEKWPSISRDDVKWLDDFTTFLIGCRNAMIATESIKELDYPTSLRLIVSKLPGYLQDGWARVADKILYHEGNLVTFNKLVEFLESENRIRLNPVFGKAALSSTNRNKGGASNQNRKVTSAGTVAKTMSDTSTSCSLCVGVSVYVLWVATFIHHLQEILQNTSQGQGISWWSTDYVLIALAETTCVPSVPREPLVRCAKALTRLCCIDPGQVRISLMLTLQVQVRIQLLSLPLSTSPILLPLGFPLLLVQLLRDVTLF